MLTRCDFQGHQTSRVPQAAGEETTCQRCGVKMIAQLSDNPYKFATIEWYPKYETNDPRGL